MAHFSTPWKRSGARVQDGYAPEAVYRMIRRRMGSRNNLVLTYESLLCSW